MGSEWKSEALPPCIELRIRKKMRTAAAPAASQAAYVGNIHTMIFHEADDVNHLPNEENRIYFASADEARQAGYRLAREPEQQPSENEN